MPNTREKLIEIIGKTDIQMIKPDGPHIPMNERFSALFIGEIADHLIANGVTVQEWISVKDRLPEMNGEYLCLWVNKSVSDAEYESIYGSFGYWFNFWEDEYKEWISYDGITHWMPLPTPPKGE